MILDSQKFLLKLCQHDKKEYCFYQFHLSMNTNLLSSQNIEYLEKSPNNPTNEKVFNFFYDTTGQILPKYSFLAEESGILTMNETREIMNLLGNPEIPQNVSFLDGFFRREGFLGMYKTRNNTLHFRIGVKQNWSNFQFLLAFQQLFGNGKICLDDHRTESACIRFTIDSRQILFENVLPVLDSFSFHSVKGLQYRVWKKRLQRTMEQNHSRKEVESLLLEWKTVQNIERQTPLFPEKKMEREFVSGFFAGDGYVALQFFESDNVSYYYIIYGFVQTIGQKGI